MQESGWIPLFPADTLEGWRVIPRLAAWFPPDHPYNREAARHPGRWTIANGVLEGRQDPPGCGWGSYLVSEATYGDFVLELEARPDWPCDTGVYLRASADALTGYQVLVDHRRSGSLAGFYGNGLGGFHAVRWNVDAIYDGAGAPCGLVIEAPLDTLEPVTPEKTALLTSSISGEDFLRLWRWDDWNAYRIECRGALPRISTYINGTLVAAMDAARLPADRFDRVRAEALGPRGHIALEVHDNDRMGEARWGKSAACRWRNMRILSLQPPAV